MALRDCGCEPSAQRPVVGSGAVPSAARQVAVQTGAVGGEAVALRDRGCEPSAQRPVVGSGAVTITAPSVAVQE